MTKVKLSTDTERPFRISFEESGAPMIEIGGFQPADGIHQYNIIAHGPKVLHLSQDFADRKTARLAWKNGFEIKHDIGEPETSAVIEALLKSGHAAVVS